MKLQRWVVPTVTNLLMVLNNCMRTPFTGLWKNWEWRMRNGYCWKQTSLSKKLLLLTGTAVQKILLLLLRSIMDQPRDGLKKNFWNKDPGSLYLNGYKDQKSFPFFFVYLILSFCCWSDRMKILLRSIRNCDRRCWTFYFIVSFLSFACTKERTKKKRRPNQMLRWFGRASAQEKCFWSKLLLTMKWQDEDFASFFPEHRKAPDFFISSSPHSPVW